MTGGNDQTKESITLWGYICHWILACMFLDIAFFIIWGSRIAAPEAETAGWFVIGLLLYSLPPMILASSLSIVRQFYGVEWRLLTLLILIVIGCVPLVLDLFSPYSITREVGAALQSACAAVGVVYAIAALVFAVRFFVRRTWMNRSEHHRANVTWGVCGVYSLLAVLVIEITYRGPDLLIAPLTPIIFFSAILLTVLRRLLGMDWRLLGLNIPALLLIPSYLSNSGPMKNFLPAWYDAITWIGAAGIWGLSFLALAALFREHDRGAPGEPA